MGSGNQNRKKTDTPIIRRPKAFSGLELSSSSKGYSYADVCIPSFDVLLKDSILAKPGLKPHLMKRGDLYDITLAGIVIGSLSIKHSMMVTKCLGMGVKYSGEITLTKSKKYARFIRVL